MARRYLVTGGAGFIGSHLCDALVAQDDAVVAFDNLSSGRLENLNAIAGRIEFVRGDIRSIERFSDDIGAVDGIIHLAALISGHDSLYHPDDYVDVNIRGLLRVIEFAAARKIPRIIFASSSTIYGENPDPVLLEGALPNPITVYAATKLTGEHLLSLYSRIHGFSTCSLRLFNVYGPRQAVNHPYANVTCKFSYAAATGGSVRRYGDGRQTRDFVYVGDVVQAFLAVLDRSNEVVYNVGTGKDASINDLLERLEHISGMPITVEQHPDWPNDIRQIRADVTRLESEFGFRPQVELSDGLEATVAFFRDNG